MIQKNVSNINLIYCKSPYKNVHVINMNEKIIKSYKAFHKNMQCRGFQYEVGKEYNIDGDIECCRQGFHACKSPMETWYYYNMLNSRFAEVEQSGKIDIDMGTKICSSHIKIKKEIDLANFINTGIDWIKSYTLPSEIPTNDTVLNDSGVENTQIYSSHSDVQIGSTGNFAEIYSIGCLVQIGSSGNAAKIHSSGTSDCIASAGFDATISLSGYGTRISSSGDYTQIGSSGDSTIINTSGRYTNIGSSGARTYISSLGNNSNIGSLGDWAKISSLGAYVTISSFGNNANITSSGMDTKVSSMVKDSIIICTGKGSMVKAEIGSWITLVEYKWNDSKGHFTTACVKTEYVDGERIKANTWYKLLNGKFVEKYV